MPTIFVAVLALSGVGADTAYAQLPYQSAFADYEAYRDPKLADWREVNERVRDAGGHPGHAKPAGAPSGPPKPNSKPKPPAGGHEGHHR